MCNGQGKQTVQIYLPSEEWAPCPVPGPIPARRGPCLLRLAGAVPQQCLAMVLLPAGWAYISHTAGQGGVHPGWFPQPRRSLITEQALGPQGVGAEQPSSLLRPGCLLQDRGARAAFTWDADDNLFFTPIMSNTKYVGFAFQKPSF